MDTAPDRDRHEIAELKRLRPGNHELRRDEFFKRVGFFARSSTLDAALVTFITEPRPVRIRPIAVRPSSGTRSLRHLLCRADPPRSERAIRDEELMQ